MHQPVVDLFGQVVVTIEDVNAWLRAVPRLDPASPRAAWYIQTYDVLGKIARAKLCGEFEQIIQKREPAAGWWHRFNWG